MRKAVARKSCVAFPDGGRVGQGRRREGRACLCFACLEEDGHVARWALSNSDGERELSCLYNDRKSTSGYFSLLYCCCYLHYHHLWAEDAVAVHHALMFRGIPPSACLAIPLPAPRPLARPPPELPLSPADSASHGETTSALPPFSAGAASRAGRGAGLRLLFSLSSLLSC